MDNIVKNARPASQGGLYLGSSSVGLAVIVAVLGRTKELGEFAMVLNGPMGMVILSILMLIGLSGFYFHILVNPLRAENAELKSEVQRVRDSLVNEKEKLRDKYEKEVSEIRDDMAKMQSRITELSTELAASKAMLTMLQER